VEKVRFEFGVQWKRVGVMDCPVGGSWKPGGCTRTLGWLLHAVGKMKTPEPVCV